MTTKTFRIGVLMGGKSIECEVSFNSGRTICDHLDTQRYSIVPIFQTRKGSLYILPQHFLHRGKISDFEHRLDAEAEKIRWDQLKLHVDFMYIAVHGRYAEDGTLQGMLEILNIPYLGSKILGSALGMNKVTQKSILAASGIDVPRGFTLHPDQLEVFNTNSPLLLALLSHHSISFPIVVKPAHEGSSLGVAVVYSLEELLSAINTAATIDDRRKQTVLIEEKICGMEFVCASIETINRNNNIITRSWFSFPVTEVIIEKDSLFFDYEQKYMPGKCSRITPARCEVSAHQKIAQTCEKVSQLLEFSTISRIDGFLTADGRVVIIDPNSLTGMAPSTFLFNQAAEHGMSHADLINFLIESELKLYGLIDDHTWQQSSKETLVNTHLNKKIRVAVLCGGDSNEREVSLESGRNVCYKLPQEKYDILPLFVNDSMELFHIPQNILIKNTTHTIAQLVTPEMQIQWSDLPHHCDFVFIGLHGGKGENGAVQGALEMLDLPYNGPGVLTSALCMDKFKANNFLRSQGINVPYSTLLTKNEWESCDSKVSFIEIYLKEHNLSLPIIIKPHDDGCSVMVSRVDTISEICTALEAFFTSSKNAALLEECIIGTELTVGVLGNESPVALPPSMAVRQTGVLTMEEKFLPGAGENQTPAPLVQQALLLIKQTIEKTFKVLGGTGYSRIDCFYQDESQSPTGSDRVVILEINTLPALTPATCLFHQAAELGISPSDFVDKIVELGLAYHRQQISPPINFTTQESVILEEAFENPSNNYETTQESVVQASQLLLERETEDKDRNINLTLSLF